MQLTSLSLFLSTPSDVQEERSIVHRVVAYLDEEVARRLGFALRLISSETMLPDARPPQEVINQQVTDYDIYVGIMWSRFGTPTAEAGSGTEEEFLHALRRHEVDQSPSRVLFYFCDRSIPFPRTDDDLAQLAAVTRFRTIALRSALVSFYNDAGRFEDLLRRHLLDIILSRSQARPSQAAAQVSMSMTEELEALLRNHNWIGYAPVDFDPDAGHYPDAGSLADDLIVLAAGPFQALLTFGGERVLGEIPRLARACEIKGVIMGVYNPLDSSEIQAAVRAAPYVDGYCVGHLGIRGGRYSVENLIAAMTALRGATRKPVSTCETIEEFMLQPDLADAVDWLFSDVHAFWHEGTTPDTAIRDIGDHIESARRLRQLIGGSKFVMLNVISYPSAGGPGLTEDAQAKFFRRVLLRYKSDTRIPARVYFCYFAGFDNTWKRPDRGWSEAELSTGLYRIDRSPKPAVAGFVESSRRT